MRKIYIGTGGIPLSCPPNTLKALSCIHDLGLNALEVEFVRGVHMSLSLAKQVGEEAASFGIKLSIHAPYFINLCSKEKFQPSVKRILDSCRRAELMNAEPVVIHAGYYQGKSSEECMDMVAKGLEYLEKHTPVNIGLETTGKVSQFGTLDEIIALCKEHENATPVFDFAHVYARYLGNYDFKKALNMLKKTLKIKHLHCHFSCIEFVEKDGGGYEKRHLPWDARSPDLSRVAELVKKEKIGFTLISESPELEKDALRMKKEIFG